MKLSFVCTAQNVFSWQILRDGNRLAQFIFEKVKLFLIKIKKKVGCKKHNVDSNKELQTTEGEQCFVYTNVGS